jgi:hypothetical protein
MRYLFFILFISPLFSFAQSTGKYWQQNVHYVIDARLDTARHQIHGRLELTYQNNSPDTLQFIWFHLWPKAYSSTRSEFARKKAESGSVDFHFASKSNWGDMDSLAFSSGNVSLKVEAHPQWIDVVKIHLERPLEPGKGVKIQTPFRTTIPTNFSRLGRKGEAYQISQWYPKPAVYDQKGWHPMPYLDQGEFYSEFGSFSVSLTVPAGYVVAATGECQTLAENQLINALVGGEKIVAPQGERKFEYKLDSIHDFAWFADPGFEICQQEFSLPSGKKITARAFYKKENEKEWQYGCEFLERSVRWYSEKVGEYPYSVVSAVDGALLAGGGMEYPTITVIGSVGDTTGLEQVILHEVGHNWFYGILGSQERQYPWMDEGVNSYYEELYINKKIQDAQKGKADSLKPTLNINGLKLNVGIGNARDLMEVGWVHTSRQGNALPAGSASDEFSQVGYGVVVYGYSARLMDYLEAWMGTDTFDLAMQEYYRRWSFKHPYPEDMQAVLEEVSGKKLDWLFKGIIEQGDAPDFRIRKFKPKTQELVLKNDAPLGAPVQVSWMNGKETVRSIWTDPFVGKWTLTQKVNEPFTHIRLNADKQMPDINSKNNVVYNRTLFRKIKPLKISVLPVLDRLEHFPVYVVPVIGGNTTDGLLAGLWFGNQFIPSPRFRVSIMPMYGFRSEELLGSIYLRKDFIPGSGVFSKIQSSYTQDAYSGMLRARPQIQFFGRRNDHNRSLKTELSLAWNMVWTQAGDLSYLPQRYDIGEMQGSVSGGTKVRSWKMQSGLRWYPEHFLLWENTLSGKLRYLKSDAVHWRAYAGYFIDRTEVGSAFQLGVSGSTDYLMNQVFLDRAITSEAYRGIINQTDGLQGGFASWNPIRSDQWLQALNVRVDLPYMPFQIYGDVANFQYAGFLPWDAGMVLKVIPDIWEFYFPILGSQYQGKTVSFKEYGTQIRFLLRLNLLTPDKLSERLK